MELKTLNNLRLIVPGIIIFMGTLLLGWNMKLFEFPKLDLDTLTKSIPALIIGIIYKFTPLRSWINKGHHERVNENIRSQMVDMSNLVDDKSKYTWKRLRIIFYDLIDNDESLKIKSQRVMINGLIWTSFADLTAISIIFLGFSILFTIFDFNNPILSVVIFYITALVGFIGSVLTTKDHIALGNEQLDLMEEKYADKIRARLLSIDR